MTNEPSLAVVRTKIMHERAAKFSIFCRISANDDGGRRYGHPYEIQNW